MLRLAPEIPTPATHISARPRSMLGPSLAFEKPPEGAEPTPSHRRKAVPGANCPSAIAQIVSVPVVQVLYSCTRPETFDARILASACHDLELSSHERSAQQRVGGDVHADRLAPSQGIAVFYGPYGERIVWL